MSDGTDVVREDNRTRDLIIRLDERVKSLQTMLASSIKELAREVGEIKTELKETDAQLRDDMKDNFTDLNSRLHSVEKDIGGLKTEDAKQSGNRDLVLYIITAFSILVAIASAL